MPQINNFRIPDQISHEDYLKALEPLCDLLGVTADEVGAPMLFSGEELSFVVAADLPLDGSRPQEFAQLAYRVTVAVK